MPPRHDHPATPRDARARALAFDLLSAGISHKHLRAALRAEGFPGATARALLEEWRPYIERYEVTPEMDHNMARNRVRVEYRFRATTEATA
jgi:hypothetical protein